MNLWQQPPGCRVVDLLIYIYIYYILHSYIYICMFAYIYLFLHSWNPFVLCVFPPNQGFFFQSGFTGLHQFFFGGFRISCYEALWLTGETSGEDSCISSSGCCWRNQSNGKPRCFEKADFWQILKNDEIIYSLSRQEWLTCRKVPINFGSIFFGSNMLKYDGDIIMKL